ncbi:MAG: HAMP domain-containing histidine kinase [Solobacterium sp.]|jgi:signal transduction histidine kinase|nr:HAMP domain-containing histidine kinase [Solobacterium sp.]MCH4205470.1 HAMP domain-containing histidine kinase [Solobacterium sp.]MCH4226994.1 HAMP domain-containing histidine kinase [Solobacterium sp.]MCH4282157.1 HAMP domain-containing histidine kinase [Solobacterium sp.]
MKSKHFKYSIWAKTIAWIILVSAACLSLMAMLSIAFLQSNEFYAEAYKTAEKNVMENYAPLYQDTRELLQDVVYEDKKKVFSDRNIAFEIRDSQGTEVFNDHTFENTLLNETYEMPMLKDTSGSEPLYETYTVNVFINGSFPNNDIYAQWHRISMTLYGMRDTIYFYTAAFLIAAVCALIYLINAAGHCSEDDEIHAGSLAAVPGDVCILGYAACCMGICYFAMRMLQGISKSSVFTALSVLLTVFILIGCLVTSCILNIAVRVKIGGFWRHTLIGTICFGICHLCIQMNTVWKAAGILGTWIILDFFLNLMSFHGDSLLYLIKTLIFFFAGLWIAEMMKKLFSASEELSHGNLNYQVDTSHMKGDFAIAGENINHIADGMNQAVEERMKSERMKTELITNVSHDIKTPLTSIINYSDLLAKEADDPEKIKEYTGVLIRQSTRLKKLIEDLIEASKASSGSLEVELVPCQVNVLLNQAAGEYEAKMKEKELELVIDQPEEAIMISADGRRLWRIFDNLLNNICKYSQHGTRVYLSLVKKEGSAEISFKNTSREQLNITAEELKERFVRGDSSRNTEGNGLGLSIAQSLTELQHGTMDLSVDGDLFKVILSFPLSNQSV